MQPRFLTGDMVMASPLGFIRGPYVQSMVIAVRQSNNVPDSIVRGLADIQPWSYWLITCGESPKIYGPIDPHLVRSLDDKLPSLAAAG